MLSPNGKEKLFVQFKTCSHLSTSKHFHFPLLEIMISNS